MVVLQVLFGGQRAVAGDNLDVLWQGLEEMFNGLHQAGEVAPAALVNEGKPTVDEEIARMHDTGPGEVNDGVAIGVTRAIVSQANLFAVEVKRSGLIIGDHRQSLF